MPRTARIRSHHNIYHIILRGINRQQIFYDREDYQYFIKLLEKYKSECGYKLYAYCLMGNHIHILLETDGTPPGAIFRHIGSAFVYWYNLKYDRTGHLFQDRFRSEPVNNMQYFHIVFRYILRNPVSAGLSSSPEKYPYSSCREYYFSSPGITDTEYVLSLMDRPALREYVSQDNDDKCLDMPESRAPRVTDSEATDLIVREFGPIFPTIDCIRDRNAFAESVLRLVQAGISIRQLSRLSGIPKRMVETSLKNARKRRSQPNG